MVGESKSDQQVENVVDSCCPRDGNGLAPTVLGASQHHLCARCSGRLFSVSEFEGLLDHPMEPWKLSQQGLAAEAPDHTVELSCQCGAVMELVHMRSSLLHCCRGCSIVWIDHLDLEKLFDEATSLDSFQFRQALEKPIWGGGPPI